jgi:hypothetical protein
MGVSAKSWSNQTFLSVLERLPTQNFLAIEGCLSQFSVALPPPSHSAAACAEAGARVCWDSS